LDDISRAVSGLANDVSGPVHDLRYSSGGGPEDAALPVLFITPGESVVERIGYVS
jgi:hypothetical protein